MDRPGGQELLQGRALGCSLHACWGMDGACPWGLAEDLYVFQTSPACSFPAQNLPGVACAMPFFMGMPSGAGGPSMSGGFWTGAALFPITFCQDTWVAGAENFAGRNNRVEGAGRGGDLGWRR